MGGIFSRRRSVPRRQKQETVEEYHDPYSEKRKKDFSLYTYERLDGVTVGKIPGEIDGEDFVIENCTNCSIYVLDHTSAVTIDNCTDCQIFIGPCKGSLFFRDCKRCVLMASCQQFRTRDCRQCIVYLHCTTLPVIEASLDMKFGCFQCHYPELRDQFLAAGLSVFNNNWYSIHNFTPDMRDSWSLLTKEDQYRHMLVFKPEEDTGLAHVPVVFGSKESVVPFCIGRRYRDESAEVCLIVIFEHSSMDETAMKLIHHIQDMATLIISKDMQVTKDVLTKFFEDNPSRHSTYRDGRVIFLEIEGSGCVKLALEYLSEVDHKAYCSPSIQQARVDSENFVHLLDRGFSL